MLLKVIKRFLKMLIKKMNIAELFHCFYILTFTLSKISSTDELGNLLKHSPLLGFFCTIKSLIVSEEKNDKLNLLFLCPFLGMFE